MVAKMEYSEINEHDYIDEKDVDVTFNFSETLSSSNSKRSVNRRPRRMPLSTRVRLSKLGINEVSKDTTNPHLNALADRLASDLDKFSREAAYWQQKYRVLMNLEEPNPSTQFKWPQPTSLESDQILRVISAHQTSLTLPNLGDTNIESGSSSLWTLTQGAHLDKTMYEVLEHAGVIASIIGLYPPAVAGQWKELTKMKPNFNIDDAKAAWTLFFLPIETSTSNLQFWAAPASRRGSEEAKAKHTPWYRRAVEVEDEKDCDALDRWISTATDFQVVDTLFYSMIFMNGLLQWNPESSSQTELVRHLGIACERLLRECMFTRNIVECPNLVQGLIQSILGFTRYFHNSDRKEASAVTLEIGWNVASNHKNVIHPAIRAIIALQSCFTANPAKLLCWVKRGTDILDASTTNSYHLKVIANLLATIGALKTSDHEKVLHHLSSLDEILLEPAKCYPDDQYSTSTDTAPNSQAIGEIPPVFELDPLTSCFPSPQNIITPTLYSSCSAITERTWNDLTGVQQSQLVSRCDPVSSDTSSSNSTPISPISNPYYLTRGENKYVTPTFFFSDTNSMESQVVVSTDERFFPTETILSFFRGATFLIRAEFAMVQNDYTSACYWLDAAVDSFRAVPGGIRFQLCVKPRFVLTVFDTPYLLPDHRYASIREMFLERLLRSAQEVPIFLNT